MSSGGAESLNLYIWLWIGSGEASNQYIIDACKASSMMGGSVLKPHYLRVRRNLLVESSYVRLNSGMTWPSCFRFSLILCLWFLDESESRRILNLCKIRVLVWVWEMGTDAWVPGLISLTVCSPDNQPSVYFNDPFLSRADICILWVSPSPPRPEEVAFSAS